jgi:hypothetical protein
MLIGRSKRKPLLESLIVVKLWRAAPDGEFSASHLQGKRMNARVLAVIMAFLPGIVDAQKVTMPDVSSLAESEEFLRQYAETYRFTLGRPRSAQFTSNGSAVLFLRSPPRSFVQDLFEFNCQAGAERVLLTANQILQGGDEQLSSEEKAAQPRSPELRSVIFATTIHTTPSDTWGYLMKTSRDTRHPT